MINQLLYLKGWVKGFILDTDLGQSECTGCKVSPFVLHVILSKFFSRCFCVICFLCAPLFSLHLRVCVGVGQRQVLLQKNRFLFYSRTAFVICLLWRYTSLGDTNKVFCIQTHPYRMLTLALYSRLDFSTMWQFHPSKQLQKRMVRKEEKERRKERGMA